MIVLGLTGSIGMGKSTATTMLRRMGVPVHESDDAVHNALKPGGEAFEEVAVTFPEAWNKKKHIIDRTKLGEIVFKDARRRTELEEILHPLAQKSQETFIRREKSLGRKIVALDIPLLFETAAHTRVDYTLLVTAPPSVQERRVLARPGMTKEKFIAILNAQMPDAEKRARADFIIPTGQGRAVTYRTLSRIVNGLRKSRYA